MTDWTPTNETNEVLELAIRFYELLHSFDCRTLMPLVTFTTLFSPSYAKPGTSVNHLYGDVIGAAHDQINGLLSNIAHAITEFPAKMSNADQSMVVRKRKGVDGVTVEFTEETSHWMPKHDAMHGWHTEVLAHHIFSLNTTLRHWEMLLHQLVTLRLAHARELYVAGVQSSGTT